ncbi:hypothetical protein CPLU01_04421 [Colletotrichum plurivorum]|uniref:Uncharacterized protein n=1 Tax=Colletotrichum plurivorum TaxID=2175906 RepID=A0A8H6KQE6_9PEZI|nr:hypothetical protein CPLU01_04421 [Colletotrichum plurivorum]
MTDLAPLGHSSDGDKAALPEKANKTRARQDTSLWEATLAAAEEDQQEGLFRNPYDFDAGDCRGCWKCWAASGVIAVRTPSHTVGGFSALKCNGRKHPRVDDQQNRAREGVSTRYDCPAGSVWAASAMNSDSVLMGSERHWSWRAGRKSSEAPGPAAGFLVGQNANARRRTAMWWVGKAIRYRGETSIQPHSALTTPAIGPSVDPSRRLASRRCRVEQHREAAVVVVMEGGRMALQQPKGGIWISMLADGMQPGVSECNEWRANTSLPAAEAIEKESHLFQLGFVLRGPEEVR